MLCAHHVVPNFPTARNVAMKVTMFTTQKQRQKLKFAQLIQYLQGLLTFVSKKNFNEALVY
jgi:DNA-binding transcriptional regulator YhcF (GntR family)